MGCNVNAERDAIAMLLHQGFPQRGIWPETPIEYWGFKLVQGEMMENLVLLGISKSEEKPYGDSADPVAIFGLQADWQEIKPFKPEFNYIISCKRGILIRQTTPQEKQENWGAKEVAIILVPIETRRFPSQKRFLLGKKAFFSRAHPIP